MVIELCECGWGIPGLKLPPHYHYTAGLLEVDKYGKEKWLHGTISINGRELEQREFIEVKWKWDRETLIDFLRSVPVAALLQEKGEQT